MIKAGTAIGDHEGTVVDHIFEFVAASIDDVRKTHPHTDKGRKLVDLEDGFVGVVAQHTWLHDHQLAGVRNCRTPDSGVLLQLDVLVLLFA